MGSYHSAEMQSVYSTAPADWAETESEKFSRMDSPFRAADNLTRPGDIFKN